MIQKDYVHRTAVNEMIQDEIEKNFLHKDFVALNFILKSELNVVNILAGIGTSGKTKEQLFEELSEKYKDENKSLILMDNSNMDTQLQFKLPNNKEHNYIKIHSLQTYRSFYQANKRTQWFTKILNLINNDPAISTYLIMRHLLKKHTSELFESLQRLKLLNLVQPMDETTALAMWLDTNIGKLIVLIDSNFI